MPKIASLEKSVIEHIAAGEVIDRPAAVVRELLDNALDARADRIVIEVSDAGRRAIVVRDNGEGIAKDDLEQAIKRHATSKLRRFEDLYRTQTLGFRGEGLSSISLVSRLKIQSKEADAFEGYELSALGGDIEYLKPIGVPNGTHVLVHDLFFNTAARRKFLKSDSTEVGRILDVIERRAIGHHDVHLSLMIDGREVINWPKRRFRNARIADVLRVRSDYLDSSQYEKNGIVVDVCLTRADEKTISSPRSIYFVANARPFNDKLLMAALKRALYRSFDKDRYPRGVIFIEMNPQYLDINVDPQKTTLRFSKHQDLCQVVESAIYNHYGCAHRAYEIPAHAAMENITRVYQIKRHHDAAREDVVDYQKNLPQKNAKRRFWQDDDDSGFGAALAASHPLALEKQEATSVPVYIGQLLGYVEIFEFERTIYLIDEKKMRKAFNKRRLEEKIQNQGELNAKELDRAWVLPMELKRALVLQIKALKRLGFELEEFGDSLLLRRIAENIDEKTRKESVLAFLKDCAEKTLRNEKERFEACFMLMEFDVLSVNDMIDNWWSLPIREAVELEKQKISDFGICSIKEEILKA